MEHVPESAVKSATLASNFASGSANIRGSVVLCAVCRVVGCPAVSLAQIVRHSSYSLVVSFTYCSSTRLRSCLSQLMRRAMRHHLHRMQDG